MVGSKRKLVRKEIVRKEIVRVKREERRVKSEE